MASMYGQCQSESFVGQLLDINGSHTHIGVQHQAHQPSDTWGKVPSLHIDNYNKSSLYFGCV